MADNYINCDSMNDPSSGWVNENNAKDGSTNTYAENDNLDAGDKLEFLFASPIYCDKLRIWTAHEISFKNYVDALIVDIDVYYDGSWHDVYYGDITKQTWVVKSIPAGFVTLEKARVSSAYGLKPSGYDFLIWELQFNSQPFPGIARPLVNGGLVNSNLIGRGLIG